MGKVGRQQEVVICNNKYRTINKWARGREAHVGNMAMLINPPDRSISIQLRFHLFNNVNNDFILIMKEGTNPLDDKPSIIQLRHLIFIVHF